MLGFSFYKKENKWKPRIAPGYLARIKKKMKDKAKRNDPLPAAEKIKKMETIISGWVNYFVIATVKSKMEELDKLVRIRLRIGIMETMEKAKD